jgi:hypothetical protein
LKPATSISTPRVMNAPVFYAELGEQAALRAACGALRSSPRDCGIVAPRRQAGRAGVEPIRGRR